jgi:hypothetical protein
VRIGRRGWLALAAGGAVAGAMGLRPAALARPAPDFPSPLPVEVRAERLSGFSLAEPERRRFGALAFRSGLVLQGSHGAFGGYSGLWRSPGGGALVAVSDAGGWLLADIDRDGERLAGLSNARLASILGPDGVPLARGRSYDTEGLAISGGAAYVPIERAHALLRFDWAGAGVMARGVRLPLPPEIARLPANAGLEAVAVAPADHPIAGALIAISERSSPEPGAPTAGFILTGPLRGRFEVARSEDFDVTDLAFLPSGEAILLERRFTVMTGVAVRIRRLAVDAFRPGARVDGPTILEADGGYQIDNMEGLAVHEEGGRTVVTLISDDNFSRLQRTVLLDFVLEG